MTDHPIIFSGPMVRALLDGRKTMTRRLAFDTNGRPTEWLRMHKRFQEAGPDYSERRWLREGWRVGKPHDGTQAAHILPSVLAKGKGVTVLYEAGGWRSVGPAGREEPIYPDNEPMPDWAGRRRASFHMPRAFSRLTVDIPATTLERLQDISAEDAIAEGIRRNPVQDGTWMSYPEGSSAAGWEDPRESFASLWRSLHGRESWQANPQVVALGLIPHRCNIDQMKEAA